MKLLKDSLFDIIVNNIHFLINMNQTVISTKKLIFCENTISFSVVVNTRVKILKKRKIKKKFIDNNLFGPVNNEDINKILKLFDLKLNSILPIEDNANIKNKKFIINLTKNKKKKRKLKQSRNKFRYWQEKPEENNYSIITLNYSTFNDFLKLFQGLPKPIRALIKSMFDEMYPENLDNDMEYNHWDYDDYESEYDGRCDDCGKYNCYCDRYHTGMDDYMIDDDSDSDWNFNYGGNIRYDEW